MLKRGAEVTSATAGQHFNKRRPTWRGNCKGNYINIRSTKSYFSSTPIRCVPVIVMSSHLDQGRKASAVCQIAGFAKLQSRQLLPCTGCSPPPQRKTRYYSFNSHAASQMDLTIMAPKGSSSVFKPVVIGGVTLGVTALALTTGGVLGVATVSVLGRFFGTALGESAKKLTEKGVETFTQKFLDKAAEPATEGSRRAHPALEDIYREAFRQSLCSIRPKGEAVRERVFYAKSVELDLVGSDRISSEYADWFDNWDAALSKGITLNLEGIDFQKIDQPHIDIDAAARNFRITMERIDAQGAMLRSDSYTLSITTRNAPEGLLNELKKRLPERFPQIFRALLVLPENVAAMNESELAFRDQFQASFEQIREGLDEIKNTATDVARDTTAIRIVQETQTEQLVAIRESIEVLYDLARGPIAQYGIQLGATTHLYEPKTPLSLPAPGTLPITSWPRMLEIDTDYANRRDELVITIKAGEYEAAIQQYWSLIYYTGTRELWVDNAYLTQRLLELAIKGKDYRTVGLLQSRGQAWPLMHKGYFRKARQHLHEALQSLVTAKASTEIGVFYEYMADMAAANSDLASANHLYSEALRRLRDLDAHEVELKQRLAQTRYHDISAARRIQKLTRLSEDFGLIKSYREGVVQMELAKEYYLQNAPEAILVAESAYHLLNNDVRMPIQAVRAKMLLGRIQRGKAIDPHSSRWSKAVHV
jgi:hypothetical protein